MGEGTYRAGGQARRMWHWLARQGRAVAGVAMALALVLSLPMSPAQAQQAARLPVETFFGASDVDDVELSPSGKRMAMTLRVEDRLVLGMVDVEGATPSKVILRLTDADIGSVDWVNDDRMVISLVDLKVGGAQQGFASGLLAVDADGSGMRDLVSPTWDTGEGLGSRLNKGLLDWSHELIGLQRAGGDEVILGKSEWDGSGDLAYVLPRRLDVVTRKVRTLEGELPTRIKGWWFDPLGEPRLARAQHDGKVHYHWRAPGQDGWKPLASFDALNPDFRALGVDATGQLFVVSGEGAGGYDVLRLFDFKAGKPSEKELVRAPGFSIAPRLIYDDPAKPPIGVRFVTDAETTVWFDARMQRWQQAVDQRLPGRVNRITCRRCLSEQPVLAIVSMSDRQPGEIWVHQPADDKRPWRLVARMRKAVDESRMATMEFHRIKARDGLDLPVWLTVPPGARPDQPLPAVVLVHGGPWVRGGVWGWRSEAQFLASRGYLVIEPEFRGSTSYGGPHFRAGWREWGRAMQDDVADALLWAAQQGRADKSRACIVGGSYGGYAALMGLVRHPELYRCAVAFAAVTDPRLMFKLQSRNDTSAEARAYGYPKLIGDPVADDQRLAEVAPLEQAARIKAPVLLLHGRHDRRVPIEHAQWMRDALRKAGNEPEWHVWADEGHGLLRSANRIDYGRRLERFLDKHLN